MNDAHHLQFVCKPELDFTALESNLVDSGAITTSDRPNSRGLVFLTGCEPGPDDPGIGSVEPPGLGIVSSHSPSATHVILFGLGAEDLIHAKVGIRTLL